MRWPTPEQQQDAIARAQLHRRAEVIKKQNEELKEREAAILFPKGQEAIRREMALARANTERRVENAEAARAQRVHEQKVATRLAKSSAADDRTDGYISSAADDPGVNTSRIEVIPADLRAALERLAAQQAGWLTEADQRWCMGCCAQGKRHRRLVVYLPVRVEWPL